MRRREAGVHAGHRPCFDRSQRRSVEMASKTASAGGVLLFAILTTLFGCTVRARAVPVGFAEITSVPVDVTYAYPSVIYEGRVVYWVNGRWIYRAGDRWLSYRTEPE